ncbi:MAG TPA: hypothetical protein VGI56_01040 [Galbitalea sp.]|jgi:hypothetical protein
MAEWSNTMGAAFDEFNARIEARMPAALAKGTEYLKSVVTPLVPIETGHLAGSGGVTVDGNQAQLYYPGPYALYQHEGVFYRHGKFGAPLRHNHGESFFLEGPVQREGQTIIQIIGDALLGEG